MKTPIWRAIDWITGSLAKSAGHQLAILLKTSTSLHTIAMAGNNLGDRGLAALCGALCHIKPVRAVSLDVSENGVGDVGVDWLTKGFSALCRRGSVDSTRDGSRPRRGGIRSLSLRGNNITHVGAKALGKLFSEDRCANALHDLDLSFNTITADGFRPLVESLCRCRELASLEMAGCRLGPGGVECAATLLASACPALTRIDLTPKADFADRVLSDSEGLAVALRHSLERVADSLPFSGKVVEMGLGAFLRADNAVAASIEAILREHREKAKVAPEARRDGQGGRKGGEGPSPAGDKPRGTRRIPAVSSIGRARNDAGADAGGGSGPVRSDRTPIRRSPGTLGGPQERSVPRSKGMAQSKPGIERSKTERGKITPGHARRSVRTIASSGTKPSSRAGTGLKSSPPRRAAAAASVAKTPERLLGNISSNKNRARPATAVVRGNVASTSGTTKQVRVHRDERLDPVDRFRSTAFSTGEAPFLPSNGQASPASMTVPPVQCGSSAVPPHNAAKTGDMDGERDTLPLNGSGGLSTIAVADVVSKVMEDTAAMENYDDSPLPVAPSTWNEGGDGSEYGGAQWPLTRTPPSCSSSLRPPFSTEPRVKDYSSDRLLPVAPSSSVTDNGATVLFEGKGSLALQDEGLLIPTKGVHALGPGLGAASGQLVTMEQAGRLIGPMVARHVATATRELELKFKDDLDTCMAKMRAEMQSMDREGLMARVAMERRLSSSLKLLLGRIDELEQRFAKVQQEERKQLALEAASAVSGEQGDCQARSIRDENGREQAPKPPLPPSPQDLTLASTISTHARIDGLGTRGAQGFDERGIDGAIGLSANATEPGTLREARTGSGLTWEAWGVGGEEPSSAHPFEEDLMDSADDAEAEMVRRLEEKMAALESKLVDHEERQRNATQSRLGTD